jgi:outer membrane biosynthesis protein TonB
LVIALGLLGLGVVAVLTVVLVALLATLMKGEPAAPTVVMQPSQGVVAPADPKANPPSAPEEPKPSNARLKISSEPTEAKVFADERFAGTTPLELTRDAPKGEVRLVLRLDGYADEPMDVAFDGDREVHVSLRKNEAQAPPEDPPKEQPKAEAKGDAAGEKKEPVAETAPVAAVEKKPAPVVEKKPAPVAEKKPAPVAEKKPAPVAEKKPEPVAEKKPTPAPTEKKPATPEKKTTGKAPVDKW